MAVVAARATRLPIYSSFAKEGNLSDLFAKGEAISTLFNAVGMGAGLQLASTVCSSIQGKVGSPEFQLFVDFFTLFSWAFFNVIKRDRTHWCQLSNLSFKYYQVVYSVICICCRNDILSDTATLRKANK